MRGGLLAVAIASAAAAALAVIDRTTVQQSLIAGSVLAKTPLTTEASL